MGSSAGITVAEFRDRTAAVAALARDRGLDAVLAWGRGGGTLDAHGDLLWLTGFYNPWRGVPDSQLWSGQSCSAALVTASGDCALITNVPAEEWGDALGVCDRVFEDPFLHLSVEQALRAYGVENGRVGLSGRRALSVALFDLLRAAAPATVFVPSDDILREARLRKSAAEVELIRKAGRVGDAVMGVLLEAAVEGAIERGVVARAYECAVEAGGLVYSIRLPQETLGDTPRGLPAWTARRIGRGELWRPDLVGSYAGYLFDFVRTTAIGGPPTDEQRELIEAAIVTVEAFLDSIEIGRPIGDAVATALQVRAQAAPFGASPGTYDYPHVGHSLGLGYEDLWLYANERRVFEPGMYLAVETVVARTETDYAMFEQNVLVTEGGVELVTHAPARPWES
jgi:Xaa-Pro aminopeptidase